MTEHSGQNKASTESGVLSDPHDKSLNSNRLVVPLVLILLASGLVLSLWISHNVGKKLEEMVLDKAELQQFNLSSIIDITTHNHLLALQDIAQFPTLIQAAMQPETNLLDAADFLGNTQILGHEFQLTLVSFSGETLFHTQQLPVLDYEKNEAIQAILSGKADRSITISEYQGEYYWTLAVPILVRGLPEGALIAEAPFSSLLHFENNLESLKQHYLEFIVDDQIIIAFGDTSAIDDPLNKEGVIYPLGTTGAKLKFHLNHKPILAEQRSYIANIVLIFAFIMGITILISRTIAKRFSEDIITERDRTSELNREIQKTNNALEAEIVSHQQTEVLLKQAKSDAEEASLAKSEFLANMSHELRTPMNAVLGMTDLLLDTDQTPTQTEYASIVKSAGNSLLDLLNDILDLSKIEAGKMELEAIDFQLRDRLDNIVKVFALRAEEKGIELVYEVQPEAPDNLIGDPGRLRQIVINLLGNAIKFTEHGEVHLKVTYKELSSEEVELQISIRDTGIGIPKDKQQQIFEAFSQADGSTTRRFGGTGLGLSISKLLVDLMDGEIWLESQENRGSTFHFTARLGVNPAKGDEGTAVAAESLKDLRVLIVDDNATNRRILEETMHKWQMQPTSADSGAAALELIKSNTEAEQPFAAIVLDAMMPNMDGFTVAEKIRQNKGLTNTTIMMLSSLDDQNYMARCKELDIKLYLRKPVSPSELLEALTQLLGKVEPINVTTPSTSTSPTTPPVDQNENRTWRILLAEDNRFNQIVATGILKKRGHSVEVAADGQQVLEKLAGGSFDAILMDIQMPNLDGMQTTAAIREQEKDTGRHIPIVGLTAHAMEGDRERFLAGGMDGYLSKPVQADLMFEALTQAIDSTS